MANRRMIYQDFFEDDYFGIKSHTAQMLWIGLLVAVADDQGRMLDNIGLINAKIFTYNPVGAQELDSYLSSFDQNNKIVRYESGGKKLIQIVNWWTYQTPAWASPSKFAPPEGWVDRIKCHVSGPKQGGAIYKENWDCQGGFSKELHSYLGSELPTGIDDVNDDVNSDVNDDDDFNGNQNQKQIHDNSQILFSLDYTQSFSEQILQAFNLKKGKKRKSTAATDAMCAEFQDWGVSVRDYLESIDELEADGRYGNANSPTSVEKWAINKAKKRSGGKKILDPEEIRKSWLPENQETINS